MQARRIHSGFYLALALSIYGTSDQQAFAAVCPVTISSGTTISSTCNPSGGGTTTIDSGAAITVSGGTAMLNFASDVIVINNGTIQTTAGTGAQAIYNAGTIDTLINNGYILAPSYYPIQNGGTIVNLVNTGTISGANGFLNTNTIGTLTNLGTISGGGLRNDDEGGSLGTLNNTQGAGNSAGPLQLNYSALPNNYNIMIISTSQYGQLAATNPHGSMIFGIYTGSNIANGTYASVLSGISAGNLTNTVGSYGSATWSLSNSSGNIWDLIVTGYSSGPSGVDTQASLVNIASALQKTLALQNAVLANSFTYDCTEYGEKNVCIAARGRNTAMAAANGLSNSSGVLIAGYRPHPNYRLGAYIDQNFAAKSAGGHISSGNDKPLVGLFGTWNQHQSGTGAEVKVSMAYGKKDTSVTRQIAGTSEAGTGNTQMNSQGAQIIARYGFGIAENVILAPYLGMRHTQNNTAGYAESTSANVIAPLSYSALATSATSVLAGLGASYRLMPKAMLFASVGLETDMSSASGRYSATGVDGLTSIHLNTNPVKTRTSAMFGAYYDLKKNQRIGITAIYRQEPLQSVSTTAVMATFTMGL